MVNSETAEDQKRVRNVVGAYPHAKDDLKELKAKIADMEAKWAAYQKELNKPIKEKVKEIADDTEAVKKAKEEEERQAKLAAILAKEKADKKAELEAQLKALDES